MRRFFGYGAILAALGALRAQPQTVPDLSLLDPIVERAAFAMRGHLELAVMYHGVVVYRKAAGGDGELGALPIASASKWLSAATVQSMVDEGLLSWDDPAGLHLYYLRDDKAQITLRQIFSHTSGIRADFHCLEEASKTADNCIQEIARTPLLYPPGTVFHYGDAAMQVGTRVAEAASGQFWEQLFYQRIAQPLGMTSTTFQPDGPLLNPNGAAGAWSTTDDYLRFLGMLASHGIWDGVRILSRHGADMMLADQTRGSRIAVSLYSADESTHPGAGANRYGLGNWLEGTVQGVSTANSSPGSYGVRPYIDRQRGYSFLVFQRNASSGFNRFYYEIQDALNSVFPPEIAPSAASFEEVEQGTGGTDAAHTAYRYCPAACREQNSECPALVVFSPDGESALSFAAEADLAAFAEREKAVVEVWEPHGSDDETDSPEEPHGRWNLELEFGQPRTNDSSLPIEAAQDLRDQPGVDGRRVYLLGVREGADVAALAVCQAPDAFQGVVLVEPSLRLKSAGEDEIGARVCDHAGRIPVMVWGGNTDDELPDSTLPAAGLAQFWASRQHCTSGATTEWMRGAVWYVTDWSGCEASSQVRFAAPPADARSWPEGGVDLAWEFLRGFDDGIRVQGSAVLTNAGSFARRHTSPGALASIFGRDLASKEAYAADSDLPAVLSGVRVEFRDVTGKTQNAGLIFVSPGQINLEIPQNLSPGIASLFIYNGQQLTHKDWCYIDAASPGLFAASATGSGIPAGEVLYVQAGGERVAHPLAGPVEDSSGSLQWAPAPVVWGEPRAEVHLMLYGTGWSAGGAESVHVMLGDTVLQPEYAGAQGNFAGLDQLNVRLDTLPETVIDHFRGRAAPIAVCTPDACSQRLELWIEKFSSSSVR